MSDAAPHGPKAWLLYAFATTILWGLWGAFTDLPAQHGFPARELAVVGAGGKPQGGDGRRQRPPAQVRDQRPGERVNIGKEAAVEAAHGRQPLRIPRHDDFRGLDGIGSGVG
jgi:hypothetical protein